MEILKIEDLCKTYGKNDMQVKALDHVNLSIEKGEFVAIIGASGSGKSTLLHMIGGVDEATCGRVIVDGVDLSKLNENKMAIFRRRKVGLIYQFFNLVPTLNVRENILLPTLLDGKVIDESYFEEIISILGLKDRLNHLPSELSGGQQQRVAIGRAMIYNPAIVLADEPTGNLDRKNSKEIIELLKMSNKKYKQTIIIITHDEQIALEASRVIKIEDGKIVSDEVNK
ncbi:ABC transporter ATP-binding protein [Niameybacter massiliensis]|uniref:ABC transporter ATP-binding protein n=1 Tax=Holtiella tumoricola TaxID=3018743 RepID=A0AA42DR29_9FIRM|nr:MULTISPECIES: ABC transporter ATP-binding protein [Lachnospirales]MDA3733522.1 ABC transporter ATP-binding protein [Holtiella tumoricola]